MTAMVGAATYSSAEELGYPEKEELTIGFIKLTDMAPIVIAYEKASTDLVSWSAAAQKIDTSLGKFPGPAVVWEQFGSLYDEHVTEREKAEAFYERQEKRNAARMEKDPDYTSKIRAYTGKETFLDQIGTSLVTVMSGFLLAAMVAIPLGIAIVLNKTLSAAFNPVIMITHDVDEAVLLSDRIVMMSNGPAATVGEILEINLEHPRDRLELDQDPEYTKLRSEVLKFLYEKQRKVESLIKKKDSTVSNTNSAFKLWAVQPFWSTGSVLKFLAIATAMTRLFALPSRPK